MTLKNLRAFLIKYGQNHFPILLLNKKAKSDTSDRDVFMVHYLSIVWRCPRGGSFFIHVCCLALRQDDSASKVL